MEFYYILSFISWFHLMLYECVCPRLHRALDKREYLMIIFLFLIKTICCDPSSEPSPQDGSDEGNNMCFFAELTKFIPNYHQILTSI